MHGRFEPLGVLESDLDTLQVRQAALSPLRQLADRSIIGT